MGENNEKNSSSEVKNNIMNNVSNYSVVGRTTNMSVDNASNSVTKKGVVSREIYNPLLLSDMEISVNRILEARNRGEKIVIVGDSDADGITGTAILYDFLCNIDCIVENYILNRREGYGLSEVLVDKVLEKNPNLIITVDFTTIYKTAFGKIKDRNIDVIITDHHGKPTKLEVYANVNPHRIDNKYPFKDFAGVGVVVKLIMAICDKQGIDSKTYWDYMDLMAVGTIADLEDLCDENKNLVKIGMEKIFRGNNLGIRKLMEDEPCSVSNKDSFEAKRNYIKCTLVPKLNAKGKIGEDAQICVRLLITNDEKEAEAIVNELNQSNKKRKEIENSIMEEAKDIIGKQCIEKDDKFIVVAGKDWNGGVLRSVARKLAKEYHKEGAVVLSTEGGKTKGPVVFNNVEGITINTIRILESCRKMNLIKNFHDGHEKACGIYDMDENNIDKFRYYVNNIVRIAQNSAKKLEEFNQDKKIKKIKSSEIHEWQVKKCKNRIFICEDMKVTGCPTRTKNGKGLRFQLQGDDKRNINATEFDTMGDLEYYIKKNDQVDVAFRISEYKGEVAMKIQALQIKDHAKQNKMLLKQGIGNIYGEGSGNTTKRMDVPERINAGTKRKGRYYTNNYTRQGDNNNFYYFSRDRAKKREFI